MTDDEMLLWRFVIENFGCVPRQLKETISAKEWIKVVTVHKNGFIGADRRDVGLAKAAAYIGGAGGGKAEVEDLLPVKLWDKPQPTAEDLVAALDRLVH